MARHGEQSRRHFLAASTLAAATGLASRLAWAAPEAPPAQIAITLDLEMSAEYPTRGQTEWNYRKGDLDAATKDYALRAADLVQSYGGRIHFFCVGQVLEQPDVSWLKKLAEDGHSIGNHTYDHIFVKAQSPRELQFRFQRSPWLLRPGETADLVRENIALMALALKDRTGIVPQGFRTPGGFQNGLHDRPDLQQLLLDQGYQWVSSLYPAHQSGTSKIPPTEAVFADIVRAQQAAQPFVYPTGLIEVPMSPISDVTAFRSHWWKRSDFLRALTDSLTWVIANGQMFDFLAHPSCLVVEDPDLEAIRLLCETVQKSNGKAVFATLDEIALRAQSSTGDQKAK